MQQHDNFERPLPSKATMSANVRGSCVLLALVSRNYFASKWCRAEVEAAADRDMFRQVLRGLDIVANFTEFGCKQGEFK